MEAPGDTGNLDERGDDGGGDGSDNDPLSTCSGCNCCVLPLIALWNCSRTERLSGEHVRPPVFLDTHFRAVSEEEDLPRVGDFWLREFESLVSLSFTLQQQQPRNKVKRR